MLTVIEWRLADFVTELRRYRPGLLRCDERIADLRLSGASAAVAAGAIAVVARPEAKVTGAVHIADVNPRRAFAGDGQL